MTAKSKAALKTPARQNPILTTEDVVLGEENVLLAPSPLPLPLFHGAWGVFGFIGDKLKDLAKPMVDWLREKLERLEGFGRPELRETSTGQTYFRLAVENKAQAPMVLQRLILDFFASVHRTISKEAVAFHQLSGPYLKRLMGQTALTQIT